eukprot:2626820-Lingulodinium_polyedra.AAC.1
MEDTKATTSGGASVKLLAASSSRTLERRGLPSQLLPHAALAAGKVFWQATRYPSDKLLREAKAAFCLAGSGSSRPAKSPGPKV